MKRNRAIDYEKGIIVAAMVFCHVLQHFGNTGAFPEQSVLILIVCAMAFSTFMFAYGRSVLLAYYNRGFKAAAPRMAGSIVRSYLAFCISGVAHRVLCGEKNFSFNVVKRVFLLEDIPGMSEFLAAFAVLGLVALVLFWPLKKLLEHKKIFWVVTFACFFTSFMPYGAIRNPQLGLLIGSTKFYLLPVLQYLPFFLAGLYVSKYDMEKKPVWLIVSGVLTAASVVYTIIWGEPGRFPPTLLWLTMPCFGIVLLDMLAELINKGTAERAWAAKIMAPVENMGRNSLYYLLTSNLILFALTNMNRMSSLGVSVLPYYRETAKFPFNLETSSTPWALFWTLIMLLGIGFTTCLCRPASQKK